MRIEAKGGNQLCVQTAVPARREWTRWVDQGTAAAYAVEMDRKGKSLVQSPDNAQAFAARTQPYRPPRLMVFGAMQDLTASGTQGGMEGVAGMDGFTFMG